MARARGSTTSSADEEEQPFAECTEQGGEDRRPQGGSEAGAARHVPGVEKEERQLALKSAVEQEEVEEVEELEEEVAEEGEAEKEAEEKEEELRKRP